MIAENGKPIITRLSRCIDGRTGGRLLAGQARLRAQLADRHSAAITAEARAAAALGAGGWAGPNEPRGGELWRAGC